MSEKLTQRTLPTDQPVEEFLAAAATARRVREGHELLKIFTEASGEKAVMWGPLDGGLRPVQLHVPGK